MTKLLEVRGLTTQFETSTSTLTVVDHIDFTIKKGQILGIVGESGCGKSVTSLSIMQLLGSKGRVSDGQVIFKGQDLVGSNERSLRTIRGKEISMIFQDPMTSLNPVITIGRQIGEVIEKHDGIHGKQLIDRVIDLIRLVGIPNPERIYKEYPHRLSGGMKQRVMIAMAIACQPSLVIADEPTTALDVTIQAQILDILRSLRDELDVSILLVTHDLGVVAELCDSVVVMYAGQVVESADTRTLLREPKHPYTKGLIQSTPHQSKGERRLKSIPGQVPTPEQYPIGCRFADRCNHVMDRCRVQDPPLQVLEDVSEVKCWLYSEVEGSE
ncbi:ABC transporter ATP-binding protein [Bacillus horti]|uniref:Peptide/nickel transport system ATP-binding protein n=1 Tax=Caldalkalibacillus horti TaxID=77523 RepID=A0ABT9W0M4_9BACI|nr:ABC transporter ATP-binding protein [Bacillus horti]MDQ0166822.1 peptide/nickel transport system ATP-binding protein [Bacillus horti]